MRSAHKLSQELLGSMAKKAGKIYGTERDTPSSHVNNNAGVNKGHSTNGGGGSN